MQSHVENRLSNYILDIPDIDQHHHDIVEHLEILQDNLRDNVDPTTEIAFILDLVRLHFSNEEQTMIDISFPYRDWHIIDHQTVIKKFEHLRDNPHGKVNKYYVSDLITTLLTHADHHDRQYADFYHKIYKKSITV